MDNEYINKGKLIEEVRKAASRSMVGEIDEPYLDWKTVVSFIFDAPAEAVAPARYGKWIKVDNNRWRCTACGKETDLPHYDGAYYCFNCGVKMKLGD